MTFPKEFIHLGIFLLLFLFQNGLCGPAGTPPNTSHRPLTSKGKHVMGKSIKLSGSLKQTETMKPGKLAVNDTLTLNSNFTRDFSWDTMEDMVRQVIVASNAVDHLEKMKSKLLAQFDKKAGEFSTARAGYGGYGAYGFPSLEGALLSIAFLTFAVFLIDLIQQLLSRFRTGTAGIVPLVGRGKRSIIPEDDHDPMMGLTHSVLNSIESPLFKGM